jgi:hypothetical protein
VDGAKEGVQDAWLVLFNGLHLVAAGAHAPAGGVFVGLLADEPFLQAGQQSFGFGQGQADLFGLKVERGAAESVDGRAGPFTPAGGGFEEESSIA